MRRTGLALVIVVTAPAHAGDPEPSPAVPVEEERQTVGPFAEPGFTAAIVELSPELRTEMTGVSWHPGCPVPLADLRLLRLAFHRLDGRRAEGELVVHARIAEDTVAVFRDLYAQGFPIASMDRIERFQGSDDRSMDANNTSAFNCRNVTGDKHRWSNHAYGLAIDVNPLFNPYVRGNRVHPEAGREHLRRKRPRPGYVVDDDATVRAFKARGFGWGGDYRRHKDWQHFERSPALLRTPAPSPTSPDAGAG